MAHPRLKWKDDNRRNAGSSLAAAILHLGEAMLHLGIGWPLAALPDPPEAAAKRVRSSKREAAPAAAVKREKTVRLGPPPSGGSSFPLGQDW